MQRDAHFSKIKKAFEDQLPKSSSYKEAYDNATKEVGYEYYSSYSSFKRQRRYYNKKKRG